MKITLPFGSILPTNIIFQQILHIFNEQDLLFKTLFLFPKKYGNSLRYTEHITINSETDNETAHSFYGNFCRIYNQFITNESRK